LPSRQYSSGGLLLGYDYDLHLLLACYLLLLFQVEFTIQYQEWENSKGGESTFYRVNQACSVLHISPPCAPPKGYTTPFLGIQSLGLPSMAHQSGHNGLR